VPAGDARYWCALFISVSAFCRDMKFCRIAILGLVSAHCAWPLHGQAMPQSKLTPLQRNFTASLCSAHLIQCVIDVWLHVSALKSLRRFPAVGALPAGDVFRSGHEMRYLTITFRHRLCPYALSSFCTELHLCACFLARYSAFSCLCQTTKFCPACLRIDEIASVLTASIFRDGQSFAMGCAVASRPRSHRTQEASDTHF